MAKLRFASAPGKRGPNKALLVVGLVVLLAAAFSVGRLWTRPAAPEETRTAAFAPTAPPTQAPAPATPARTPAFPPGGAPVTAFVPTPSRTRPGNEVFVLAGTPPTPAPRVTPTETPKPDTLARQIGRCLTFTVARDNMFTVTSGVRLVIKAQNHCGQTFPGQEARFEVRAMAAGGTGMAGRERGIFQTTIPPFGSAETVIVVPCDPDGVYRFEVEVL